MSQPSFCTMQTWSLSQGKGGGAMEKCFSAFWTFRIYAIAHSLIIWSRPSCGKWKCCTMLKLYLNARASIGESYTSTLYPIPATIAMFLFEQVWSVHVGTYDHFHTVGGSILSKFYLFNLKLIHTFDANWVGGLIIKKAWKNTLEQYQCWVFDPLVRKEFAIQLHIEVTF